MFLATPGLRDRGARGPGTARALPHLLGLLACCLLLCASGPARADLGTTRDALDRLEELLELRRDDGRLHPSDVLPTLLVSARPRYEESRETYPVQVLSVLTRVFGAGGVRSCEACMAVRTRVEDGRLEQHSGPVSLDEIVGLDDRYRGESAPARTAAWIDETPSGVAVRFVDLRSAGVVFAQNIDPDLREYRGSKRTFRLAAELERRARGDSLTHATADFALYPGQHISLSWNDQWGATNSNLSGLVISLYDPVLGIGASYDRILKWAHISVGAQLLLSIPQAVAEGLADADEDLLDPLLTGALTARIPLGRSGYAGVIIISTNGEVGVGISLLNTSLIPVLP